MSRFENIAVFEDTVKACKSMPRLQDSIAKSLAVQQFIAEENAIADGSRVARFGSDGKIVVSRKRSFEAARSYAGKGSRVCVLNFASSSSPGGGVVNGAGAQEECLCRTSTLYFTLDTDENWKRFYNPHRRAKNPLHNDDIIYTKDITVFKSDTRIPETLPESSWYDVDVMSCAAPNLRERPSNRYNPGDGEARLILSDAELRKLHERRDARIFDVAVQNEVDVLVLGAFGCGAFCNNPAVVADVMLSLARKYIRAFKVIEFAVYCPPHDDSNYREFADRL